MRRALKFATLVTAISFMAVLGFGTASAQDVIKIGFTNSFSGMFANPATKVWQGAKAWEAWVNAQGGIYVKEKGKKLKVQIISYDDESSRETLIRLHEQLAVTDKVDVFFAPYSSGQTYVVAPIADKYKKLMIASTASSEKVYAQGYKYIVQALPDAEEFGRPYVDIIHAADPQYKRLAMVYEDSLFPKSTALMVRGVAKKLGYNIVFFDKFPGGAQDVTPVLTRIRNLKPDHIYVLALAPATITAVRQMAELKVNARSIGILDNGMYYFKDSLGGKILNGILGPVEWDISARYKIDYGPDNDVFVQWHNKLFPEKKQQYDNHSPLGFNVGLMLQRAIEEAGTLDSTKLRQVFCTLKMTTLVGSQQWYCTKGANNGMMKKPGEGGMPALGTQWRADASTVTVWPAPVGDLKKVILPKPAW